MNKIQYIELLKLSGITELNGKSIADAIKSSGGEPTQEEMVEVNYNSMIHFAEKAKGFKEEVIKLTLENNKLSLENDELNHWRRCLEAAGVDNWDGYEIAQDMMEDDEV